MLCSCQIDETRSRFSGWWSYPVGGVVDPALPTASPTPSTGSFHKFWPHPFQLRDHIRLLVPQSSRTILPAMATTTLRLPAQCPRDTAQRELCGRCLRERLLTTPGVKSAELKCGEGEPLAT